MNAELLVGSTTSVHLSQAILLYQSSVRRGGERGGREDDTLYRPNDAAQVIATIHDVENGIIGAGSLITRGACVDLAHSLLRVEGAAEFLPPHILSMGLDHIVWHTKPGRRQMWFEAQASTLPKKADRDKLKAVNGETLPQPGLIFVAGRTNHDFRVFAVDGAARPTPKTKLFRAPYWNISETGHLCHGSTPFPPHISAENTAAFEAAFFKSRFTHPTGTGPAAKLDQPNLWTKLRRARSFPTSLLVPAIDCDRHRSRKGPVLTVARMLENA